MPLSLNFPSRGLDPRVHVFLGEQKEINVDGRVKPGQEDLRGAPLGPTLL
jgi:hypothetical protein